MMAALDICRVVDTVELGFAPDLREQGAADSTSFDAVG